MPNRFTSRVSFAFLFAALANPCLSQNNPSRPTKVAVTECEGVNNCTTWTFMRVNNKMKGFAKWSTGEEAVLEVESASNSQVSISRTDVTGSKQGLTASYTGVVHGRNVGGEFTSEYNGKTRSGNWYWVDEDDQAASLPVEMHFCGQGCFALHLVNGRYQTTDGRGIWTVRQFDGKTFALDRADASGFVSYYKGDVLNNHLVNIVTGQRPFTADWRPGPDTRYNNVILAWGTELNAVPGDGGRSPMYGAGGAPAGGTINWNDVGHFIEVAHDGAETLKIIHDLLYGSQ